MKIRTRLTLTLLLAVLFTMIGLGLAIYFSTAKFHKKEFFTRLEERVQLAELILLEKDATVTQAVREKFLQKLDEENEYAIALGPAGLETIDSMFYDGLAAEITDNESTWFWHRGQQGVAKRYHLKDGEYAVIVTAEDKFGQSKLRYLGRILLIGTLLCTLILVAVTWFSSSRALKPLEKQIQNARQIGANRLDLRLEINNPEDELGELAVAFNNMLDRLQASFESQKHFVSNASHEIRNPLTTIIGETELLLEKPRSAEEYQETLKVISEEAERLEILTRQLLDLANAESLTEIRSPKPVSLDLCLLELLEKLPASRIRLSISMGETERFVTGNRHLLHIALSNIMDNALKYSGEKKVFVELTEEQDFFRISFKDDGIGIPKQDLPNIFQPLHRARNVRNTRGHGIGLPLAKKIIALHGGSIEIETEEGKGTTVYVKLPRGTDE